MALRAGPRMVRTYSAPHALAQLGVNIVASEWGKSYRLGILSLLNISACVHFDLYLDAIPDGLPVAVTQ
jgi:hypothetical protein